MSNTVATAAPTPKRTFKQALASESGVKWLYLIPLLVFLVAFMLYPTFYCLIMSFCDYVMKGAPEFAGLENYRDLLEDSDFWQALWRTAYVLIICISVELILGMAFALILNRDFVGQDLVRGLCFLPLLISPLAMSLMWNYMLHVQFGIVNQFLNGWGWADSSGFPARPMPFIPSCLSPSGNGFPFPPLFFWQA